MIDKSHLHALELRLSNERARLANSTTENESKWRQILVAGIEKEIAGEKKFLGISESTNEITDDELLNELFRP